MGTTAEELRRELSTERSNIGADLEAIGDRVSPGRIVQRRKAATRRGLTTLRERVMGSADQMASSVTTPAAGAVSSASEKMSSVAETLRDSPETMRRTTQGNPLGAGLVAFGLGLVVATLIPESDTEKRVAESVQPKLEEVASSAGHAAHEVMDAVKPAAQEAAESLKQGAQDAVDHVKESAAQAAKTTAEEAAGAVKQATPDQHVAVIAKNEEPR